MQQVLRGAEAMTKGGYLPSSEPHNPVPPGERDTLKKGIDMATPITDGMSEPTVVKTDAGHVFTGSDGNRTTIGKFYYFTMNEPVVFGEKGCISFFERVRMAFWFYVAPIAFVLTGRAEVPRGGVRFKQTEKPKGD